MRLSTGCCNNLVVELRPSGWAGIYLPVLGVCLLLSVSLSGIAPILKTVLLGAVSAWFLLAWARRPGRIMTAVWQTSGNWRLQSHSGDWVSARLLHAWSAGPAWTVLYWREQSGARQLALVTPAVASEASRRRLSCHLRWRPGTA